MRMKGLHQASNQDLFEAKSQDEVAKSAPNRGSFVTERRQLATTLSLVTAIAMWLTLSQFIKYTEDYESNGGYLALTVIAMICLVAGGPCMYFDITNVHRAGCGFVVASAFVRLLGI